MATGKAVQYVALSISHQPGLEDYERFAHIPILDTRPASQMSGLVVDLKRLMDSQYLPAISTGLIPCIPTVTHRPESAGGLQADDRARRSSWKTRSPSFSDVRRYYSN